MVLIQLTNSKYAAILYRIVVIALLLIAFAFMTGSVVQKSVTVDEQSHLFRGVAYIKTGATHFLLGHPLLGSIISALPLLTEPNLQLPLNNLAWEAGEWPLAGDAFLWDVNEYPQRLIFLGRLPVIWMTLLLGALVFRWGRELAGLPAAVLAMALVLLDPNVLAHGRFITGDLALTLFFTLTIYGYWRWAATNPSSAFNKRHLPALIVSGIGMGMAGAVKFNAALLVPILGMLGLYLVWKRRSWRPLAALIIVGVTGWILISVVYGLHLWQGFLPGGAFWDDLFWELGYFKGIHVSYLAGQYTTSGWWYYFPVTFLIKTPLPTLLLLGTAIILTLKNWRNACSSASTIFLLIPPFFYMLVSMGSPLNIGYRYLLPMLPFLFLFTVDRINHSVWVKKKHSFAFIAHKSQFVAVIILFIIAFITFPDYVPYFNLLVGNNGWRILSDSNVDWGQDLPALAEWQQKTGHKLKLSYFGMAHPSAYGLDFEPLVTWQPAPEQGYPPHQAYNPAAPAPGWYAISVTALHGAVMSDDRHAYAWFREREPVENVNGSIFIYEVLPQGEMATVAFSQLRPGDLHTELHEQFATNDVQPRWFDVRESMFWPADGGWMAISAAEIASSPELAALQPDVPIAEADGQLLYTLPSPPPLTWATDDVPFGDALTFLGQQIVDIDVGEVALLTAWRVEKGDEKRPLKLFIHAVNENDEIVGQWDGLSIAPDAWMSGDMFVQSHSFTVDEGNYRLAVGVYDAETGERLSERYFLE